MIQTSKQSVSTGRLILVAFLAVALAAFLLQPAMAAAKDEGKGQDQAGTDVTENNDDDGVPNCPDPLGDADNRHPSGKDKHCEAGKSGNQGQAKSDPDDDGRGPDRSTDGSDQPGGTGGLDELDQDGNHGCGTDDDDEDDNEGWCGTNVKRQDKPPVDKPPVDKPPVDKPPVDKPGDKPGDKPVDKPPVDKPPVDKPDDTQPPVDKPDDTQPPVDKPDDTQPPVDKPDDTQPPVQQPEDTQPEAPTPSQQPTTTEEAEAEQQVARTVPESPVSLLIQRPAETRLAETRLDAVLPQPTEGEVLGMALQRVTAAADAEHVQAVAAPAQLARTGADAPFVLILGMILVLAGAGAVGFAQRH